MYGKGRQCPWRTMTLESSQVAYMVLARWNPQSPGPTNCCGTQGGRSRQQPCDGNTIGTGPAKGLYVKLRGTRQWRLGAVRSARGDRQVTFHLSTSERPWQVDCHEVQALSLSCSPGPLAGPLASPLHAPLEGPSKAPPGKPDFKIRGKTIQNNEPRLTHL
jgi:hypothetical protein